ncbi:MAG: DUF4124 domain-containing protein [Candidatus Sedimenticola sp. PURPLELP]
MPALRPIAICTLVLSLLLIAGNCSAAKLYRWVDSEGNVHFSDKVPAEHSKSARSELDKQGMEVKKIGAAKTPEEIQKERELKRLRAEQQRLIKEQQAKDRVLLRTFRTEDDIMMARNGKLAAIDVIIQISRSNIRRMKLKLGEMQNSAANLERQGKPIPKNLLKDIESTRTQLKDGYRSIIKEEQKKEVIREKFGQDIARFRSLKKLHGESDEKLKERDRISALLETVVVCQDETSCANAWLLAEKYIRSNATTRIQMLGDSIIMTGAPIKDDDISLTVSRIRKLGESHSELFMDLQCKNSPKGDELCASERVGNIRGGFRESLKTVTERP